MKKTEVQVLFFASPLPDPVLPVLTSGDNIRYQLKTQRGNRREDVFFSKDDYHKYLHWLKKYCLKHKVEILAYCLMTNHIHLILRPKNEDGLQNVLKPVHMRYAHYVNRMKGWKGHLWQGRFFSSALDDVYTWSAIRYVERNPVRAKMIKKAEDYPWSSAAGHCGLRYDDLLVKISDKKRVVSGQEWSEWLKLPDLDKEIENLRKNVEKGLPCGSDSFISKLERISGRVLVFRPQGRPLKG